MVEGLHDPDLAEQFLQGAGVQLGLVNDFDRHLLPGGNVFGKFNLNQITIHYIFVVGYNWKVVKNRVDILDKKPLYPP